MTIDEIKAAAHARLAEIEAEAAKLRGVLAALGAEPVSLPLICPVRPGTGTPGLAPNGPFFPVVTAEPIWRIPLHGDGLQITCCRIDSTSAVVVS